MMCRKRSLHAQCTQCTLQWPSYCNNAIGHKFMIRCLTEYNCVATPCPLQWHRARVGTQPQLQVTRGARNRGCDVHMQNARNKLVDVVRANYKFRQRGGICRAAASSTVSLNACQCHALLYAWSALALPETTCSAARDRKSNQKGLKSCGPRHRDSRREFGAAPRASFGNCQYGSPSA